MKADGPKDPDKAQKQAKSTEPPKSSEPTVEHGETVVGRRPRLSWRDPDGEHQATVEERTVVGSAPGVDVVVSDRTVSRLHAELEPREDGLWARDLGSRNGTFVNGVRVERARIPQGGTLRLGSTAIEVTYDRQPIAVELWPQPQFGPLLGRSSVMRRLFARLDKIARTDSSVLVVGETGTGKELVARAIHEASPRKDGPLVVVDCAALPESLIEAELFGHSKGAFTGAGDAREGAIESADGGTVFLDEVGELPLAVQPKLLRVLESREVRPVGESRHRKVDVRFVSATHRDLRQMVNAGAFREDLYFRIAVLPVTVPPLRERPDDVALLAEHLSPAGAAALDAELLAEIGRRPWLGNVRELRNFVERAHALGAAEALALSSSPASTGSPAAAGAAAGVSLDGLYKEARERWLDHFEREYFRRLLEHHDRNVSEAARAAGVDRTYVYRMIRRHGL
jgi:two-component system, NtrC family, response regulator GlrR